jgi:hypothetical protein
MNALVTASKQDEINTKDTYGNTLRAKIVN